MAYTLATAAEAGGVSWLVVLWGIRSGCIVATRGNDRGYRIDEDDLHRGLDRLARRGGGGVNAHAAPVPAMLNKSSPRGEHRAWTADRFAYGERATGHAVPAPCRSRSAKAARHRAVGLRLVGGTDITAH